MKLSVVILSIVFAASVATVADAATKYARHHHAAAGTASKTDWPGNPYMDSKPEQVNAFFRDAFNPAGAKW
jgi:hypothetical protein